MHATVLSYCLSAAQLHCGQQQPALSNVLRRDARIVVQFCTLLFVEVAICAHVCVVLHCSATGSFLV
jgi:hypothetical protein